MIGRSKLEGEDDEEKLRHVAEYLGTDLILLLGFGRVRSRVTVG